MERTRTPSVSMWPQRQVPINVLRVKVQHFAAAWERVKGYEAGKAFLVFTLFCDADTEKCRVHEWIFFLFFGFKPQKWLQSVEQKNNNCFCLSTLEVLVFLCEKWNDNVSIVEYTNFHASSLTWTDVICGQMKKMIFFFMHFQCILSLLADLKW